MAPRRGCSAPRWSASTSCERPVSSWPTATAEIGQQYGALNSGQVQAADVNTTDGELSTGDYTLLADPFRSFGWGNVVPVVTNHALAVEGPAFATTINAVTALLTTPVIRMLNAQVDIAGELPANVAAEFLAENGLG